MVTMQTLYHDGGFNVMGISDELVVDLAEVLVRDDGDT